jgi:hypothetical protein
MTRSIFDPSGNEADHSGTTYTGPDAQHASHLPLEFTERKSPEPAEKDVNVGFEGSTGAVPAAGLEIKSENGGKLLVVHLTGKLHRDDYQRLGPAVEQAIQQHGKVRMLVEMRNFHGWDMAALWEDVKFDIKHFRDIERLALVGDKTWEQGMATFCKPFTTATIRYFPVEQAAAAREWIALA